MTGQPNLFDKNTKRDREFEEWRRRNSETVDTFLRFAQDVGKSGLRHYGIKAIAERVRWHYRIETRVDDYKVNNNYLSRLARLLVDLDPSLAGLFSFRKIRS